MAQTGSRDPYLFIIDYTNFFGKLRKTRAIRYLGRAEYISSEFSLDVTLPTYGDSDVQPKTTLARPLARWSGGKNHTGLIPSVLV